MNDMTGGFPADASLAANFRLLQDVDVRLSVEVGSTWHNVSKIAGVSTELTYELTELTGERIVLVGTNETATSTDTITVVPSGSGSEVTYEATIEMKGAAKLGEPIVKVIFEKVGNDTEDDLTTVLNGL